MGVCLKTLDQIVETWSFGFIQDCMNLLKTLEINGFTFEDLRQDFSEIKNRLVLDAKIPKKGLKNRKEMIVLPLKHCSECGEPIRLFWVNNKKSNMVGGDYQSQWYCRNCGESIFNELSPYEEMMKLKEASLQRSEEKANGNR